LVDIRRDAGGHAVAKQLRPRQGPLCLDQRLLGLYQETPIQGADKDSSHQSGRRHDAPRPRQPPGLAQKGVGTASALGTVLAANGLSSRFATLAPLFAARRASALAQGDAGTSLGGFKPGRLLARGSTTGSLV
jgi:hypothetical protein